MSAQPNEILHSTQNDDEVELLRGLLERYSPSEQERPAVEYLVAEMARRGFQAHIDEAGNAVGVIGSGDREIMLLGHIDTVPGQIPVRQEGDRLYGRGAVDAKGPLCAFVSAAARAGNQMRQQAIGAAGLRIIVAGAVEEESASSRGARHLLTQHAPDCVVIGEPSGWERITLGYKGRLLMDCLLRREASHTARQEVSVCEELVEYWNRLKQYVNECNRDKEHIFDAIDPSLRRIVSDHDGLNEQVEATIAFRLPLEADHDAFKRKLISLAPASAVVTFYAEEVAFRADKDNSVSRALRTAIRECGGKPAFKVKTGTSDMNVVGPVWHCPIVAYGPGDSSLDHTPNEHIEVHEYRQAIAVLTRALLVLADDSRGETKPQALNEHGGDGG